MSSPVSSTSSSSTAAHTEAAPLPNATASVAASAAAPAAEEKKEKVKRVRKVHTKETVAVHFALLRKLVEDQITELHTKNEKGSKFLRTVGKHVRELESEAKRAFNTKVKVKRTNTKPTGFMKPVKISNEMTEFAGVAAGTEMSRVEVTKAICKYVKDNKLYNEKDKRIILPDNKLKALLRYPPANADPSVVQAPLTYFYLQKVIGHLFPKEVKPVA